MFYKENKNHKNNKKIFEKEYFKISRNKNFKITKIFLVFVYQKMIKQGMIDFEPHFLSFIQKCPARNLSG